ACYGCWCTHFRLPPAVRRTADHVGNKAHIRARIEAGPPPGLLAFDGGRAVGWMQIGPRADVPEWNNKGPASSPMAVASAHAPSVWAISCCFIHSAARGAGPSHHLGAAGVEHARAGGARVLEACPMTEAKTARSIGLFGGSQQVFDKAGFSVVTERK